MRTRTTDSTAVKSQWNPQTSCNFFLELVYILAETQQNSFSSVYDFFLVAINFTQARSRILIVCKLSEKLHSETSLSKTSVFTGGSVNVHADSQISLVVKIENCKFWKVDEKSLILTRISVFSIFHFFQQVSHHSDMYD